MYELLGSTSKTKVTTLNIRGNYKNCFLGYFFRPSASVVGVSASWIRSLEIRASSVSTRLQRPQRGIERRPLRNSFGMGGSFLLFQIPRGMHDSRF